MTWTLKNALLGLGLVLGTFVAAPRAAEPACLGGVQVEGSIVRCRIELRVESESEGKSLAEATYGIVRAVTVVSDLVVDMNQLDQILHEGGLQVPEQIVDLTVETNGSPIAWRVGLAPALVIETRPDGQVVATGGTLNARDISGSLPTWVRRSLIQYLNENQQIKQAIIDGANEALGSIGS